MKSKSGLYYKLEGDRQKPVIVFSNSLGTDLSMWDEQVARLKDFFCILRYDTRGHGQSDDGKSLTIADLAQDVVGLLDELKISKAWFCGISLGGLTGLKLALEYPERFEGFVLSNTSARIASPEVWKKRRELVQEQGLTPVAEASPARWFTDKFTQGNQVLVQRMLDKLKGFSPPGYIACCEAIQGEDLWEKIRNITLPVLFVAGTSDVITTPEEAHRMQSLVKGAKILTLEASHLANIEKPEEFSSGLLGFINGFLRQVDS